MARKWVWLSLAGCSEYGIQGPASPPVDPAAPPPASTAASAPPAPAPAPDEPIAVAGPDQQLEPLDTVELSALASHDPQGLEIVAVRWRIAAAPAGSTTTIDDDDRPLASFLADLAGAYVIELTVQNEAGVWDTTPDSLVVEAIPDVGFYVQLTWDAKTDLDLHLLDGSTPLFEEGDCSFCNMNPHWGVAGTDDDPSLDIDAINGFGPETITIDDPADGVYTAAVHFYGERGDDACHQGCDPSNATVVVYLDGAPLASFQRLLEADDQLWTVADIVWPDGDIVPVDTVQDIEFPGCTITAGP